VIRTATHCKALSAWFMLRTWLSAGPRWSPPRWKRLLRISEAHDILTLASKIAASTTDLKILSAVLLGTVARLTAGPDTATRFAR
jgi:hypothetical protein